MATEASHTCNGVSEKTGKSCGRSVASAESFCSAHTDQQGRVAVAKHGTNRQRMLVVGMTTKQLAAHIKERYASWRVDPKAKIFVRNRGEKTAMERSATYKVRPGDEVQFHRPAGRLG